MKLWNFTNPKIKKVMDFKPMSFSSKISPLSPTRSKCTRCM